MALWAFILLSGLAVSDAQSGNRTNQSDLHQAMSDMRGRSYHGFVILLKLLNPLPHPIQNAGTTFLMPNNQQLSELNLSEDSLREFILSHSIPTTLTMRDMLHFPDGSLVPSSVPHKMLSITNNPRFGLSVNNARIVTPNVCLSSLIKCHGISASIVFNTSDLARPLNLRSAEMRNMKTHGRSNSSRAVKSMRTNRHH